MRFFDPHTQTSPLFAVGGAGHLGLLLLLFGLLAMLVVFRGSLPRLRQNRALMVGPALFVLAMETSSFLLGFVSPGGSLLERLPLHLCASLKLALALCVLFERYDWVKHVSTWAIGAGFISFANLNLEGASFGNYAFWTYVLGHLYIFLLPIFLFLTGDLRYELAGHLRSLAGLAVWSFIVFLINWAFDTNFMYSGPHNHTPVPFLPDPMMVWPFNYLSYVLTGAVLLNVIYGLLRFFQARLTPAVNLALVAERA